MSLVETREQRGVVLRPRTSDRNTIRGADGQTALSIRPDKDDPALEIFQQHSSSFPRLRLVYTGIHFGDGSGPPSNAASFERPAAGFLLRCPNSVVNDPGLEFEANSGKANDGAGTGGPVSRLLIAGGSVNGVNGTRGDSPLVDSANIDTQTAYAQLELRNSSGDVPSTAFDDRGSYHQVVANLHSDPGSGSGPLTTPFGTASTNVLTMATHGLSVNDPIQFSALTGGTGLSTYTPYFVIASGLTANEFKVSASPGGSEVDFTTNITAGTLERIPYAEAFNWFSVVESNRTGVLVGAIEGQIKLAANQPARPVGCRMIMFENNPLSAYSSARLGAGSVYIGTGARAFEAFSQGTERTGVGFMTWGGPGYEWAVRCQDPSGAIVSGIDGNGGVINRVIAGTPTDANFRKPQDGLQVFDSVEGDLVWRAGGVYRYGQDKNPSKAPVRVASTTNLTLTAPGATIDGITMASGNRVLVKDQTTETANGIYVWNGAASTMTRARDADEGLELGAGVEVAVQEGTLNGDCKFMLVTNGAVTIGSTNLRFTRSQPSYARGADRDPWAAGVNTVAETFQREHTTATALVLPTSATTRLCGGCVIPANRLITNINVYAVAAGASYTIKWFAIVKQSDRTVLQRTANSTSALSTNVVNTIALQATYTPPIDTPVWIAIAVAAGTAPSLAVNAAGLAPLNFHGPILSGNSTTTPTSTPAAVGAVLGAPSAGQTQNVYAFLT